MKSKLAALIAAVLFGIIAAIGIAFYLNSIVKTGKIKSEKIKVYVAAKAIKQGQSTGELLSNGLIKKKDIPREYVADGKVTNLDRISGQILNVPLSKGEQLTLKNFKGAGAKGMLPFRLKKNQLAVTVPIDKFSGVDHRLNPGDKISIYATFNTASAGTAVTRLLLDNIAVINEEKPSAKKTGAATGSAKKQSLTLAVPASEAARLVFAADTGDIWMALQKRGEKNKLLPSKVPTTSVEVNLGAIVGAK